MPESSVVRTTHDSQDQAQPVRIAVYSDRRALREDVRAAIGSSLDRDYPSVELTDFATAPILVRALHNREFDLCLLDGETAPLGGIGLAYQIRNEVDNPPPLVLLLARRDDAWLATWSKADEVVPLPIDPLQLPATVSRVLSERQAMREAVE
ncbi:response regulator [uncultured Corynebacterium sp.]|uniref:response regulator n=1 Tax=uncultured Corynebacterium sp. TaxID=159447 RepID=UPI00260E88C9|nr:response regulator [uncultured Corynebacterium sp.]